MQSVNDAVLITRPQTNHPNLEIITTPLNSLNSRLNDSTTAQHVEFRVYNESNVNKGQRQRYDGRSLIDLLVISALMWSAWSYQLWDVVKGFPAHYRSGWNVELTLLLAWIASCVLGVRYICNTILYESLTPLPGLGVQIALTRGVRFPWPLTTNRNFLLPISTSYSFVPLSEISTVILNQALHGFSVRYYLSIVKKDGQGVIVGFNTEVKDIDISV
uniref:Phosphatidylinositol N-acetylglucosaminyltransferase subunit H conserved domain-containing protein n=1 Tax=Kwoniella pini CBS 10737 TaxID=1296096 RepID=A0A1B9HZX5_9TREE|nr:uncharacterized protein I206_05620 [Kwoniella pini CBS 10737]OCF48839.1 hypothetical protein I206_05620 [Kwoniella pini CBS 10737]